MTRYLIPGAFVATIAAVAILSPRDGSANSVKGAFTIVYTGDVVGTVEPCG